MVDVNNYLPENLFWKEREGIVQRKGDKEKRIANAVPTVRRRNKYKQPVMNSVRKTVTLQYQDCNNVSVGEEQEFEESDIMDGKFMRNLPIEVQIDNKRMATEVFRKTIQNQVVDMPVEEIEIFPFGWHYNKFHWNEAGRRDISRDQEYGAAIKVLDVLNSGNREIAALILAAVHGPLNHILESAGIRHDFITFLVGLTSVGKTALAKKICGYQLRKSVVLALSSERKELRKVIQKLADVTIVVDDFNTSASERMLSRQLQIVSEIIQGSCDAGEVILEEGSGNKRDHKSHLVITGETIIRNVSTMNRCFLVTMRKPIPENLWTKVSGMDREHIFLIFMQSFVGYIEKNYDLVVSNCIEDFKYYKQHAQQMLSCNASMNRLAETMAIQYTLKMRIVNYLKYVGIDESLCNKAGEHMDSGILCSMQELKQELDMMVSKKKYMEYLPTLAGIITCIDNGYTLAVDEARYLKKIKMGEPCVGFIQNPGYLSFNPHHMCKMIAEELKSDEVSHICLGKELGHYHLVHVDYSEQRRSCTWHTKKKYFHVHILQLLELFYGADDDDIKDYVERMEEKAD